MSTETVKVGKYTFVITENVMSFNDMIISHTFKIGGSYDDCMSVSYTYRGLTPISAKLMTANYEPECSLGTSLEKGGGTALMLKTLLRYVYKKIPSIKIFTFEDMSHIDCEEKDLSKPPPRKLSKPLSLSYLSIAYNSSTWYEKYFDAKMTDSNRYREYKIMLEFLTNPSKKVDFITFLQIAKPPKDQYEYLEPLYNMSNTYRDFFKSIPFDDRCNILFSWLVGFMDYYFGSHYSPFKWQIDVTSPKISNDGLRGGRKRFRKRQTVKRSSDFPSHYKIISYRDIHGM